MTATETSARPGRAAPTQLTAVPRSACRAADLQSPGAEELAIEAKVLGSETAVRVLTDLMRVVGVESYDRALPLGRLLQDALALPLFGGGNIGVRRRQLHAILKQPGYDPLMTSGEAEI